MPEWNWTQIADHPTLTEGPVWDGSGLLYNECYANTTFRWDPKANESAVWRENTGQANGMSFDRQGQLYVCEGDAHRVTRLDPENPGAEPMVISNPPAGGTLNWPNDLAIDSQGRVYFTDPNYTGDPNNLPHESVYMTEHTFGGNWNTTRVTFDTKKPNGVLLSLDQKTLFVAESTHEPGDPRQLRAYPVNAGRLPGPARFRTESRHRRHDPDFNGNYRRYRRVVRLRAGSDAVRVRGVGPRRTHPPDSRR